MSGPFRSNFILIRFHVGPFRSHFDPFWVFISVPVGWSFTMFRWSFKPFGLSWFPNRAILLLFVLVVVCLFLLLFCCFCFFLFCCVFWGLLFCFLGDWMGVLCFFHVIVVTNILTPTPPSVVDKIFISGHNLCPRQACAVTISSEINVRQF